jgi:hypothetical protein
VAFIIECCIKSVAPSQSNEGAGSLCTQQFCSRADVAAKVNTIRPQYERRFLACSQRPSPQRAKQILDEMVAADEARLRQTEEDELKYKVSRHQRLP